MIDEMKINAIQREKYLSKGYWKDITLLDCWKESVKKYSEREYVVDDRGNRYTYRQMDEAASTVAAFLRKQGVLPGDAVSFQLPIWSEFVVVTIACFMSGAVAHPIAMSYEEKELIRSMNLTESKVYFGPSFFHKTDYASRILAVRERIPSLSCVVIVGGEKPEAGGVLAFEEILDRWDAKTGRTDTEHAETDQRETDQTETDQRETDQTETDRTETESGRTGEDLALILCTSGTTSGTKGVLLTHNNIRYSEEVFTRELGLTCEDIMFMPAPLNHATGFHHGLITPMLIGAKVVLQQKYRCREAIDLMNRERCTFSMGATPFIYDILRELENGGGELPFLKLYLCGGAPVPGYMVQKAWSFGILLCEVYGSTESVPHVFVRPDEALELNGTTSGRPMEGVEIRVVDDEGNDVPPGVPGEELSRGPNVFVGYLKDKKITDGALDDDGWFHSGDLCVRDEAGNIHIIGRKKDMIVRGGENLNSNEINDWLEGCPGMGDHTVIGMPDDRLGERICAFAVPLPGFEHLKLEDVTGWLCQNGVPKRFWPERLELIDRIPHTGSGKVKKYLLKEELEKRMKG